MVYYLHYTENNPAIDLDSGELVAIASSIGTPVSSFLMQDEVSSVIPEGVEVPAGEAYGTGDSGTLVVSVTALLLSAIAAFAIK